MIAMRVDGPLRENDVRFLGDEQAAIDLVVFVIDDGAAVDLIREYRAGFQDLARSLSFGRSDLSAEIEACAAAEALAAIEVEKDDLVAQIGVPSNGAGAAAFRIAGMAARDDDL